MLTLNLIFVGFCLFAANQANEISSYGKAGLFAAIFAGSISTLSLALFSIRAMGMLYMTRPISLVLLPLIIFSDNSATINTGLAIIALIHFCLFSESLISKMTRDIGSPGEECFILKTPTSISIWFTFTWFVVWASFAESVHLFLEEKTVLGLLSILIAIIIFSLFIGAQTRTLFRRCVIVPNGLVASDPIALTDVLLFPLSKIKTIEQVSNFDQSERKNESTFISNDTKNNIVSISLNEKTDSLIARNAVSESTRQNVDKIYLSFAEPKQFVKTFHSRFHKVEAKPLSKSQEKMLEKELGIETAPRSDSPLPKWRKGKTSE